MAEMRGCKKTPAQYMAIWSLILHAVRFRVQVPELLL